MGDSTKKNETVDDETTTPPGDDENALEDDEVESDELEDDGECPSDRLIEDSQLFNTLELDDCRQLFESGEHVTFEPGDIILTEGEEGDTFFLIEDGEVEVTTRVEDKTVVLATLTRGDIFGEVTAFSNTPRTATVAAASLVEAIRFENEELKALLVKKPDIRAELEALILDRARDTIDKITNPPESGI